MTNEINQVIEFVKKDKENFFKLKTELETQILLSYHSDLLLERLSKDYPNLGKKDIFQSEWKEIKYKLDLAMQGYKLLTGKNYDLSKEKPLSDKTIDLIFNCLIK